MYVQDEHKKVISSVSFEELTYVQFVRFETYLLTYWIKTKQNNEQSMGHPVLYRYIWVIVNVYIVWLATFFPNNAKGGDNEKTN